MSNEPVVTIQLNQEQSDSLSYAIFLQDVKRVCIKTQGAYPDIVFNLRLSEEEDGFGSDSISGYGEYNP